MESTYKQAFLQLIDFLETLEENKGLKYYLVGGILVNLYSNIRNTRDIDIVIDLQSSNITLANYISLLEKNNYYPLKWMDWEMTLIMAKRNNKLRFLDKNKTVRYDNHILGNFANDKYQKMGSIGLKKRVREKILGIECWVCSKEDYLLGSLVHENFTDALGCLVRFQNELDKNYLMSVSSQLDIEQEYSFLKSGIDDPDSFFKRLRGY